jgi:hypothetical protein
VAGRTKEGAQSVIYARRKDSTHKAIALGLVAAGFSVADTSRLGGDFPDLVIGKFGFDAKVECKSSKKIHKQKGDGLSDGQKTFKDQWKGAPVIVAQTLEDVLFNFNLLLKRHGWAR